MSLISPEAAYLLHPSPTRSPTLSYYSEHHGATHWSYPLPLREFSTESRYLKILGRHHPFGPAGEVRQSRHGMHMYIDALKSRVEGDRSKESNGDVPN
jgi:hypothetical protein